jgi:hypothetical protein
VAHRLRKYFACLLIGKALAAVFLDAGSISAVLAAAPCKPEDARSTLKAVLPESGAIRLEPYDPRDYRIHRFDGVLPGQPTWAEVEKIIRAANKRFEIRGWSGDFLGERLEVARKHARRSEYVYLTPPESDEIRATLGISWASYSRGRARELLPMESTHGWRLPRLGKGGSGVILEARTYSMSAEHHLEVFPNILSEMARMVEKQVRGYPGLMGEPILYTYGDDTSVRMYRLLGFEEVDATVAAPVDHAGTRWHVLRTSPRELLERNRLRLQTPYVLRQEGRPAQLLKASGAPQGLKIDGERVVYHRKNQIAVVQLVEPGEVAPGLWAEKGAYVSWGEDGLIEKVSVLHKEAEVAPGIWAAPGSMVDWHEGGALGSVDRLSRPAVIDGRYELGEGASFLLDPDGQPVFLKGLAKDTELFPGIVASPESMVSWKEDGSIRISRLAAETRLTRDLWAMRGSKIEIRPKPSGEVEVVYISRLSRPVIRNGIVIPPGRPYSLSP